MTATSRSEPANADAPLYLACGLTLALGPLTGGLAWFLRWRMHGHPKEGAIASASAAGLVIAVLASGLLLDAAGAPGNAVLRATADPDVGYDSALRPAVIWWLASLPLAPALAWVLDWTTPKTVRELERRQQRRDDKRHRTGSQPEWRGEVTGVELGKRLAGDPVLPERKGVPVLPWPWLGRHALVLGSSGSGKTETLLKLAHGVARNPGWAVFFIDGKGDRETMRRFYALMRDARRRCRLFPDES